MKIKCKCLILLCFVVCLLTSCVSKKNIIKTGALCGIIVDENNNPVPDFLVYCFKNEGKKQSTITNKSGIFVFPDVDIGNYFIEGEKENYAKIEKKEYSFTDCSSLFSVQIISFESCLEKLASFVKTGEFHKGVKLLDSITVKSGSLNEALLLSYSAYFNYKLGNMDNYKNCINALKEINNEKCNLFVTSMEDIVNG